MCAQRQYIQFHNIKFKIPKSQTTHYFKNWQNTQNINMYQKYTSCFTPPPQANDVYVCENVDNYGWPLSECNLNRVRDSSGDGLSSSYAGDPGSDPQLGLDLGHTNAWMSRKRLPVVKVIMHQLAWLTGV